MIFKFLFIFLFFVGYLLSSEHRRIGIRHDVDSSFYYNFWRNDVSYETSNNYPNLSLVGALISNKGHLGTATLVASNYIVTAAHVMKNSYFDDPDPADWQFILHDDYKNTISSSVYQIQTIIIHPGWTARQEYTQRTDGNSLGDGDILGLDLALLQLNRHVRNIFPARLPSESDDPLGLRTVLAGFGVLVNGNTGTENRNNTGLVGGENTIDRSVAEVSVDYQIDQDIQIGGLLGIDFDSNVGANNALGFDFSSSNYRLIEALDLLGSGDSLASPMAFEASTADGDSGGPAFVRTSGAWRVHGVVSYGTSDSSYGDVTLYTRLASHYGWLNEHLPNWADSKVIESTGWLDNPWLGKILPIGNNWVFSQNLGWLYIPISKGNSFWSWSDLLKKWIWLSDKVFPFVYCYNQDQSYWLFILVESSNSSLIHAYDYSTSRWSYHSGD